MSGLTGIHCLGRSGMASTNMRKSTIVLSCAFTVLFLCILVVLATSAHKSPRGQANLPPISERSAPDVLADLLIASSDKPLQRTASPPKLELGIIQSESSQPVPDSISESVSGRVGYFDSAIASQGPDLAWAKEMMTALRAAFAGVDGVSIDSLECGQTLCRLELGTTTDDDGPLQAKIGLANMAIPTSEQAFRMTAPPMPPRLIVYTARENTELPSPSE
jgi:hypothetical protein